MKITPEKFVDLLKNSSLKEDEIKAIIKSLPQMSPKQIDDLADILKEDVATVSNILEKMENEQKKIVEEFEKKKGEEEK